MLRLTQDAMKRLFQSTIDSIHKIISSVLDNPKLRGQLQYLSESVSGLLGFCTALSFFYTSAQIL